MISVLDLVLILFKCLKKFLYVVSFQSQLENSYFSPLFVEHCVLNDITTFFFKPQFYLRVESCYDFWQVLALLHINMKKCLNKKYFTSYNIWYLLRTEKSSSSHFLTETMAVKWHGLGLSFCFKKFLGNNNFNIIKSFQTHTNKKHRWHY